MEQQLLSLEERQRIISRIQQIIPDIECPICHNKHFIIAEGYFNSPIQGKLDGMVLGGLSIPSVGLVCSKCGFISHHALGVLGLLPSKNENVNDCNTNQ